MDTIRNLIMASADGIIVAFLMATTLTLFGGTKKLKNEWFLPIGAGIIIICINWLVVELTTKTSYLCILFLIMSIGFMIFLACWWIKEGSLIREMLPFIIMGGIFYYSAENAGSQMVRLFESLTEKQATIIEMIPTITLTLYISIILINYFVFRCRINQKTRQKTIAFCHAVCAVAVIFLTFTILKQEIEISLRLADWLQNLPLLASSKPDF